MKTESKLIRYKKVSEIKPDPNNPRKTFDDAAIAELAESIKQIGVLQPIIVRKVGDEYRLVCGERRWRASKVAGLATIPVIVRDLTDDEAIDFAITENLQRRDVSPIEEADAFDYLLNKGGSIAEICARFGKSEFFVRGRLRLKMLSPEFKALLESGEATMAQAMELAKFDGDIQAKAYENWEQNQWGGSLKSLKPKSLFTEIGHRYTNDLENQDFDTTQCLTCEKCSKVFSLFECEEMLCMDSDCMRNKSVEYDLNKAMDLMLKYPAANMCTPKSNFENLDVTSLREKGYAITEYKKWRDINEEMYDSFNERAERGEIIIGVRVGCGEPDLVQIIDDYGKELGVCQSVEQEIRMLHDQDVRNRDIVDEKSVQEVNEIIKAITKPNASAPLTELEQKIDLYLTIKDLGVELYKLLYPNTSLKYHIDELEAWNLAEESWDNPEMITKIKRYRFIKQLPMRWQLNTHSQLAINWLNEYKGEDVTTPIFQRYLDTYNKRHAKIEEKIATLREEDSTPVKMSPEAEAMYNEGLQEIEEAMVDE